MSESVSNVNIMPSFSRPLSMEDFCDSPDNKNKYNKNNSYNDNISKNQQEFGHKKRIKP